MGRVTATAITAVLLCVFVEAADPGPKAGFREFSWGDAPSEDMIVVPVPGASGKIRMDLYWRADEFGSDSHPIVADRSAEPINYYFYKNGLCRVQVTWNGIRLTDLTKIGDELSLAWGKADAITAGGQRAWKSRDGATVAVLQHDTEDSSALLTLAGTACTRQAANETVGV